VKKIGFIEFSPIWIMLGRPTQLFHRSGTSILIFTLLILATVLLTIGQTSESEKLLADAILKLDEKSVVSLRESLVRFEGARKLFDAKGDKPHVGECLYWLGRTYSLLSENQKALESYTQALPLLEAENDRAVLLNDTAEIYRNLGDNTKALDFFDRAFLLFKSGADINGQATVLNNKGSVYLGMGQRQKALELYALALPLLVTVENKGGAARTLANMGSAYVGLGENEKALDVLNRALALLKDMNDKLGVARTLNTIGKMYFDLGNTQKAFDNLSQAAMFFQEIGDAQGEAGALTNLGMTYSLRGEKLKALELFDQALTRSKVTGDQNLKGIILNDIGLTYIDLGDKEKALSYIDQGRAVHEAIGNQEGVSMALNNIGSVNLLRGEYTKALENFGKALTLMSALGLKRGEASALNNIMHAWESLGNNRLAIVYGKRSINKRQELRQAIQGFEKQTQLSFLGTIEGTYKTLADIMISEGRIAEARTVLDLLKDEEYRQLTRSTDENGTIPYSKAEAELIAKIDNLVALERERTDLQRIETRTDEQNIRLEQLRAAIAVANKAFEDSMNALSRVDSSTTSRVDEILGGQEIQSALSELRKETKSGVVALYTVLGSEEAKETGVNSTSKKSFGWVIMVTDKSYKAYPIDTQELSKNVFQFRTALSSDKYDPRPLGEKIYTSIFRQTSEKQKRTLEEDLRDYLSVYKDKTIMWSLDGVLRYIPMAALHDGRKYLVEDYRSLVFTKQSFLWLTKENQPKWQALGFGVSDKRENFEPLPGVKAELEKIINTPDRHTGILNGNIALNDNFKKEIFFNSIEEGKYPVVHIASHYSFNPAQQESSFLVLGDGRLTFGELKDNKNLFGRIDLLTLSACETGVTGDGKEAEGFAYLAQSLGAKSVIASLWKISDAGTPELMIRFYRLRKDNPKMSKGEAFRQAQLSLLNPRTKDERITSTSTSARSEFAGTPPAGISLPVFVKDPKRPFAHPHYWASFVMIGNWR